MSFNLAYSVGAKIRLLQMYGSNNSAVPAPVMNMRGEFVHRWQRPGDEEYTNVPGLLDAKSYEKTKTPGGMISPMNLPERFGICMTIPMYVSFREII